MTEVREHTAPIFEDLRGFLSKADELGMLRVIENAHWNLELGAISEIMTDVPDNPILLFDKIPGYPPGYRVMANHFNTAKKVALAKGLPLDLNPFEMIMLWRDRRRNYRAVPPVRVDSGPVMENVMKGKDVDLLKFPVPQWHLLDGGRYLGTGTEVITRDPDSGWVNMGTYRQSVLEGNRLSIFIEQHHHGRLIAQKYWAKGEACPVAACYGAEEALFTAAFADLPPGVSEYDFAGWLRGAPVPILIGEITGLPIPANAEIAIEGEIPPPEEESHAEGPFREWTGYYSQAAEPQPVIRVKAIYHRRDPIIVGTTSQSRFINAAPLPDAAGSAFEALERAGVPGVRGAWSFMQSLFVVVSIEQQYAGHSKWVLAAMAGVRTAASANRYYVVVDEDIDPTDLNQVLWAICTRVEPSEQIDIVRGMRAGGIDPVVSPEKRQKKDFTSAIMLIDACKPFAWKEQFGKSLTFTKEYISQVRTKWGEILGLR
jgi:UbiD family decarboxylase